MYPHQLFIGRVGRLGYLFGSFYYVAVCFVTYFVLAFVYVFASVEIHHTVSKSSLLGPVYGITIALYLALIIGILSVTARRLNDVDRPAWFCIFGIIPFVNVPLSLYLLFAPGMEGKNTNGAPTHGYGFWDVTKLKALFQGPTVDESGSDNDSSGS
jgi:uncharacterized membrane protein YhaH (DUF805 family)